MSKTPKNPASKKPKGKPNSAAQQKAGFRSELVTRIESEHEAVQFGRGIAYEDLELALGVGDLKAYFKQVESNFLAVKDGVISEAEKQSSKPKIKIVSSFRSRKERRKQKGKINKK